MKLQNNQLIEDFYNQEKDKYPNLTLEQFKDICFGPWRFLKDEMESGELPTVRFKYFGTFQVYEGRAKNMLHNINKRFQFHKINPKQYFKLKEMLEKFLNGEKDNS
jgi:hypothetical protein